MANNKKIRGLTVEIGGDTTKLGKALDDSKKKSKNLQTELRQVEKLLKMDPGNVELLAQKQKILTDQVDETKKRLSMMKEEQEKVNRLFQNGEIGEADYRKYQREVEQTRIDLEKLEGQLKETGDKFSEVQRKSGAVNFKNAEDKAAHLKGVIKDMADSAVENMEKVSKTAETVGTGLEKAGKTLSVGSAVAGAALGASTKFAMDFEDAMAKVSTIADENEVPMDKMREQILALSNDTGIAATDIAENVYNAISSGQKTGDAVSFVAESLSLSKAGFADTGAALDVLTTIMNAYGMSAEEVGDISDILIQTQNLGKVTVGELASSMGKVIPTANQYGVSLDQLAAAYSITTAKGIAAAESTTYINSMLNELGKSDSKASQALKEGTGKTFTELMGEGKSLSDVLAILQESADKNNKSLGDMFGSAEAAKAASTLLGDSAGDFNNRLKEMNGSTGATDKALDKLKTTSTETKKIVNELKNAGIDLGDEVLKQAAPLLKDVMGGVKNLTDWLKKLKPEQKETLVKAIEIMAVVGPGVTILGKLTKGVGSFVGTGAKLIKSLQNTTVAQMGLNAAMDANPVGAVTLAITAFVAVLGGAITAINAFHDAQLENAGFKDQLDDMQETVDKISEIRDGINNTVSELKNASLNAGSEMGVIDDYRKRLDELLEKSNLTPAEQAELTTIGDYFAQKYPEFEKTWNEYVSVDDNGRVKISGNVEELKGKLDSLISKYKQVAAQAALSNLAQQNAEAVVNSRQQVRDAAAEMLKASEELEEFQKEWNLTDENLASLASAQPWFEWENADKSVKVFAGDLLNQYNALVEKGAETTKSYEEVVEGAAQLKQSGEDLARMQAVVNGNYDDAAAVMMTYNEGLISTVEVEQSKWKSLDNLSVKAKETSEKTGSNLVYGLKSGIDKYKNEIFDSGIEQAKLYLDSFDATMGIESPSKEMYKRGQQTVQGFINGLKDASGLSNIWNTAKNVASTALNAVKNFLGIHSPSKEAEKLGSFFGRGFTNGIAGEKRNAAISAEHLAESARNALQNANIYDFDRLTAGLPGYISDSANVRDQSGIIALSSKMDVLIDKMDAIAQKEQGIYLDGNILVGRTVERMDNALYNRAVNRERGV